jgi:hypothetical protein
LSAKRLRSPDHGISETGSSLSYRRRDVARPGVEIGVVGWVTIAGQNSPNVNLVAVRFQGGEENGW